jgi:hypothetical protein
MSTKKFLRGSVEFELDKIKELAQYFEAILTYNAKRELVPKKDENGKEKKKIKMDFSIFEEGNFGNNVSFMIPQTKEQRDNGETKKYIANGKIYSTSQELRSFVQKSESKSEEVLEIVDDLPF